MLTRVQLEVALQKKKKHKNKNKKKKKQITEKKEGIMPTGEEIRGT